MLLLYILLVNLGIVCGYTDGLYTTEDDDVTILNNETFTKNVVNRRPGTAWCVEFYNTWCGHCMRFAPVWKRVALDFANWRDIVVIAAIDCSQENNLPTCRAFNRTRYPAVRMYPPVDSKHTEVSMIEATTLETYKQQILENVVRHAADSWPDLTPLKKLDDFWVEKKANQEYYLVIFEEENSLLGTQVILDLRDVTNVLVRRMAKSSVDGLDIQMIPSLYRVNRDFTYVMVAMGSQNPAEDRLAFVRVASTLARSTPDLTPYPQGHDEGDSGDSSLIFQGHNASSMSMQDLESALHYSLRHEVAMSHVIDVGKLQALHNFLKVLVKYFPGRRPVRGYLSRVFQMLANLKSASISGNDWTEKINHLQDKDNFLPGATRWEACQGSTPHHRGYPCSLWMLFHTLTVHAYIQNVGTDASSGDEVLLAVRGYMKDFFGCQECSKNFVELTSSIKSKVRDHESAVMWLWDSHNSVNKRLHGEPSEDPQFPKIEFPSAQMCPRCRALKPSANGLTMSWSKKELVEFLVKFYSPSYLNSYYNVVKKFTVLKTIAKPERVIESSEIKSQRLEMLKGDNLNLQPETYAKENQRESKQLSSAKGSELLYLSLGQLTVERVEQKLPNSEDTPQFDLNLLLMFYFTSTVILIMLCYCLLPRGCRVMKRHH